MYDLLECKSVCFSLMRKENGQFSKLTEESTLDLLMKEDFRNFIYELTFVHNKQANEALMHNMSYLFNEENPVKKTAQQQAEEEQQKKQMESLKRETNYKKQV